MIYRYETHLHCSLCSMCAVSTPHELVHAYHSAGYAGFVLTDHFIFGNTCVNPALPWNARMRRYYGAYLDAVEAAAELDFDVLFGIEHAFGHGKELLLYGIDLDFLLSVPDLPKLSIDRLVELVHDYGGLAIQAHPYRSRFYIAPGVEPRLDIVDGIEVYNAANTCNENLPALNIAREHDFILTSGGDVHSISDSAIGHAGIALPYRVHDGKELVAALRRRDHQLIVGDSIVDADRLEPFHMK